MKKMFIPLLVLALLTSLALAFPVMAASVTPIQVEGNPNCVGLGYDYGFKPATNTGGVEEVGNGVVTWSTDGTYVDWSSTIGLDAVIMKGGNAANVYQYDPPAESFGDTGLVSPNNASGNPAGLSHVEFCFDYEVVVEKTAFTSYTREYTWKIEKDFDGTYDMFVGDSVWHEYTVSVDQMIDDKDYAVEGDITIYNPAPMAATITGVFDNISGFGAVMVDCGVSFPYDLAPKATLTCSYDTGLPNKDSRTNTAEVTTTGAVGGGSDTAAVVFGAPTTIIGYPEVDVTDTNGESWHASGDASWSYSVKFSCGADEGQHINVAEITETGQTDTATVDINCYELEVSKDAATTYTRKFDWTIDKTSDTSALTLAMGEVINVNYDVTVDATFSEYDFAATGNIEVFNPAPMAAELLGVADVLAGVGPLPVSCPVDFPYTLGAGETLTCTYTAVLPDKETRTNTATATLQNTPSGTTEFSGLASVNLGGATVTEVDKCVVVNDTLEGYLGTVCYPDVPTTFSYTYQVGPYDVCGDYTVDNTATFTAITTGATGSDDWTIDVNVPCGGCTLTQGYWKTHSEFGPAPYDDNWANLPMGANTPFYLSGKTWYQVFWTAPAGNPYYVLAHQFMAAKLNILNGASSTPAVDDALTKAGIFFNYYTPASKLSKEMRATILAYAAVLDNYNNGYIGPGHCSE